MSSEAPRRRAGPAVHRVGAVRRRQDDAGRAAGRAGCRTSGCRAPTRRGRARPGETDGVDYNFVTRDRFEAMIAAGEFLEWADVFGNLYGTCASDTERLLAAGDDVVLVIDVQGARQVRRTGSPATTGFRDAAVVRGARAAAARPEQGQRGGHPAAAAGGARRGRRVRGVRLHRRSTTSSTAAVDRLRGIVLAERARLARMQAMPTV